MRCVVCGTVHPGEYKACDACLALSDARQEQHEAEHLERLQAVRDADTDARDQPSAWRYGRNLEKIARR